MLTNDYLTIWSLHSYVNDVDLTQSKADELLLTSQLKTVKSKFSHVAPELLSILKVRYWIQGREGKVTSIFPLYLILPPPVVNNIRAYLGTFTGN